jgi:hypothetical protein
LSDESEDLRFYVLVVAGGGREALKQLADAAGTTLNGILNEILREKLAGVELEDGLGAWISEQYERNLAHRRAQDERTASGYYRVKHPKKRGRPPKPKKRGRPRKKVRKTRCDKDVPRGQRVVVVSTIETI